MPTDSGERRRFETRVRARPARVRLRGVLLLSLVAAAASACAPSPSESGSLPRAFRDTMTAGAAANDAYLAGRWDEAADLYRRQAEQAARDERLAGWRDEALYNLACVEARRGRPPEAAQAFAASLAHGFRPRQVPDVEGAWRTLPGNLTLPHLLADPDLDGIREEPAYRAALRPYLEAGELRIDLDGAVPGALPPLVLRLASAAPAGAGRSEFALPGAAVAVRSAPIAPLGGATGPADRRWVLEDGDLRWGVAAVRAALDETVRRDAADPVSGETRGFADPAGVHLVATDPETADVAFAAALAMPDRVAGFVAIGVRTPRPLWADALAAVPAARGPLPPWKVVVGPGDDVVAEALEAIGAEVVR